jgi:hypothetical protein
MKNWVFSDVTPFLEANPVSRNVVCSSYLAYQAMDKVQKSSDFESYTNTPPTEDSRTYQIEFCVLSN